MPADTPDPQLRLVTSAGSLTVVDETVELARHQRMVCETRITEIAVAMRALDNERARLEAQRRHLSNIITHSESP